MIQQRFPLFLGLTIAVCSAALLSGCGKKANEAAAPADTNGASAANATATAAPAPAPVAVISPEQASLEAAQAAEKAKEYDRAAEILLALQLQMRQAKTPEQANAIANQMRQFQQNLSAAVARGDPKAIAAAQRLRQASTPH